MVRERGVDAHLKRPIAATAVEVAEAHGIQYREEGDVEVLGQRILQRDRAVGGGDANERRLGIRGLDR